jgi:long-chain acyl-CoA synthetase
MEIAAVAARDPQRPAIYSQFGDMNFDQLNRRVNQVARQMLAAGIGPGDPVALLCGNRPEFVVVRFACHRLGVRLTPVNWHLAPDEIAYVVENCDALALFADLRAGQGARQAMAQAPGLRVKVSIGGAIEGFEDWDASLEQDDSDIDAPALGSMMLYTSGTTGRPKGVLRNQPDPQKAADMQALLSAVFQFQPGAGTDLALTTGPLYHAGPFNLCMTTPLTSGIGTVLMDQWTPQETLALIEKYRITHTFLVPTMMQRLLQVDESTRQAADISSMRFIIHGAAPCTVDTKRAMLDWFGPIIWEMFAGTEGPGTIVSPREWLDKPGTVGKPGPGQVRILDEEGAALAPGEIGQVYLVNPPDSKFSYYKDQEKTGRSVRDGYFTAGDLGYLDADGYLFLTGRSAEIIISGGVNIYPQEIDDVLAQHPAVLDVACVGAPSEEWGEEVRAVVQLAADVDASNAQAADIIAFCEGRLARQKHPRGVDFIEQLPRSEAGKVQRRALRDSYWQEQDRSI